MVHRHVCDSPLLVVAHRHARDSTLVVVVHFTAYEWQSDDVAYDVAAMSVHSVSHSCLQQLLDAEWPCRKRLALIFEYVNTTSVGSKSKDYEKVQDSCHLIMSTCNTCRLDHCATVAMLIRHPQGSVMQHGNACTTRGQPEVTSCMIMTMVSTATLARVC